MVFGNLVNAQFRVSAEVPANIKDREAYLYIYNGTKSILVSKIDRVGNAFTYKYARPYHGFMRISLPDSNYSVNFVSENKDVALKFNSEASQKISGVTFLDEANVAMNLLQEFQEKKTKILPALVQIKAFYSKNDAFTEALDKEVARLSGNTPVINKNFDFLNYYSTASDQYLSATQKPSGDQMIEFLVKSNDYLETSTLIRPLLLAYLNTATAGNTAQVTDRLLDAINVETPRGQTILSEIIDIFDSYGMEDLKKQYLSKASNLKCTITDRLAETIKKNKDMELGATFKDYIFKNAKNTAAKSIAGVKTDKKIIVFWSSTCSHCEHELPQLLEKYRQIKSINAEIIGLSVDNDRQSYESRVASLPWINDAEMKGWQSSYVDAYNIHATPTYFILDSDNKIITKPDHAVDVLTYLKIK